VRKFLFSPNFHHRTHKKAKNLSLPHRWHTAPSGKHKADAAYIFREGNRLSSEEGNFTEDLLPQFHSPTKRKLQGGNIRKTSENFKENRAVLIEL
jgi:hypothetical protein